MRKTEIWLEKEPDSNTLAGLVSFYFLLLVLAMMAYFKLSFLFYIGFIVIPLYLFYFLSRIRIKFSVKRR